MSSYICWAFDHGGVIETSLSALNPQTFAMQPLPPGPEDLLLFKDVDDIPTVVKYGKTILPIMAEEAERNPNLIIAFHSKNRLEDQLKILKPMISNGKREGINIPTFKIIPAFNRDKYAATDSTSPIFTYLDNDLNEVTELPPGANIDDYCIVANWGADDLDGKASVRQAIEAAGTHLAHLKGVAKEIDKAQSHIFDDGPSIFKKAKQDGWNAHEISEGLHAEPHTESLKVAVMSARDTLPLSTSLAGATPSEGLLGWALQLPTEAKTLLLATSVAIIAFGLLTTLGTPLAASAAISLMAGAASGLGFFAHSQSTETEALTELPAPHEESPEHTPR